MDDNTKACSLTHGSSKNFSICIYLHLLKSEVFVYKYLYVADLIEHAEDTGASIQDVDTGPIVTVVHRHPRYTLFCVLCLSDHRHNNNNNISKKNYDKKWHSQDWSFLGFFTNSSQHHKLFSKHTLKRSEHNHVQITCNTLDAYNTHVMHHMV